jgi:anaerobic dimethyl sulfoxide reductase subunit B (iron-sulfur subunit)
MPRDGLLIEYEYCTGCQSCVVACKQEHGYPVGIGGIKLNEIYTEGERLRIDYLPFPTKYCDLCAGRVSQGEKPACVKACQAATMWYGDLTTLAKMMEGKPHSALFTPR